MHERNAVESGQRLNLFIDFFNEPLTSLGWKEDGEESVYFCLTLDAGADWHPVELEQSAGKEARPR